MPMATRSPQTTRKPRPWRWTRAHLARLPNDGQRYEVLDGALLVTPQARLLHQRVAAVMMRLFDAYCEAHGLGIVVGPGAVVFDDNELQPDVQVIPISDERARAADWDAIPLPLLVVEILSPGSERHDLHGKRAAYLRLGIPVYLAVDITARRVLEFRPGSDAPSVLTDELVWRPASTVEPLVISLHGVFGE